MEIMISPGQASQLFRFMMARRCTAHASLYTTREHERMKASWKLQTARMASTRVECADRVKHSMHTAPDAPSAQNLCTQRKHCRYVGCEESSRHGLKGRTSFINLCEERTHCTKSCVSVKGVARES